MILTVRVEAPISEAQAAKEIIGMKLERIGRVQVVDIRDDGYGRQMGMEAMGRDERRQKK